MSEPKKIKNTDQRVNGKKYRKNYDRIWGRKVSTDGAENYN